MKRFSQEACAQIVARVEAGLTFADAADASGVKIDTAKTWLKRGRKEETGPYADFAEAIEQARSERQPMTEGELKLHVSEMVRQGSTQAAKLYWEMILDARKPGEDEKKKEDPLDGVDELAQRRQVRA